MISQEKINRSFSDQVRQLTAQRDQLAAELNQRNVNDATATIKGLQLLAALAAAGNPPARQALKDLLSVLEQAKLVDAGIVVVKS